MIKAKERLEKENEKKTKDDGAVSIQVNSDFVTRISVSSLPSLSSPFMRMKLRRDIEDHRLSQHNFMRMKLRETLKLRDIEDQRFSDQSSSDGHHYSNNICAIVSPRRMRTNIRSCPYVSQSSYQLRPYSIRSSRRKLSGDSGRTVVRFSDLAEVHSAPQNRNFYSLDDEVTKRFSSIHLTAAPDNKSEADEENTVQRALPDLSSLSINKQEDISDM